MASREMDRTSKEAINASEEAGRGGGEEEKGRRGKGGGGRRRDSLFLPKQPENLETQRRENREKIVLLFERRGFVPIRNVFMVPHAIKCIKMSS
jgi:hypothetical protein